jgi:hypothetical protein
MALRPKRGVRPGMSKFELELKKATKIHKRKYLAWKPRPKMVRKVEEKKPEEKKPKVSPMEKPPIEEKKP